MLEDKLLLSDRQVLPVITFEEDKIFLTFVLNTLPGKSITKPSFSGPHAESDVAGIQIRHIPKY